MQPIVNDKARRGSFFEKNFEGRAGEDPWGYNGGYFEPSVPDKFRRTHVPTALFFGSGNSGTPKRKQAPSGKLETVAFTPGAVYRRKQTSRRVMDEAGIGQV